MYACVRMTESIPVRTPAGGCILFAAANILPSKNSCPLGQEFFCLVHPSYNFPHCLPVKKRRVVVARNTLPARSTVVGNSGCEGLQG